MQPQQSFSPSTFFRHGKSGGRAGSAKGSSAHAFRVVDLSPQPQPLRFDSPPAIPSMEFQNQPGHIGSKPNIEKPMGKFLPSPGVSFFSKGRQQEFQDMRMRQEMATTTLVRHSARFQNRPMSLAKKQKLAQEIAGRALKCMGGIVALQSPMNESFDKDPFMLGLIEKAKSIKKSSQRK